MAENHSRIREFLAPYLQGYDIKEDEDIFSLGLMNSLVVKQLVLYVEKEFNITYQDDDLDVDNFRTIAAIDDFVTRKQMTAGEG